MANPFLTENEKRNLAIKNNAYNQVLQGFEQPQQEDTDNDDGFLGAAKRAVVGTGASMAGGLGYLLGAEGMADSMQKTAQENARLRDYDSIWNWQYATDPYGLWYDIVSTGTSAAALAPMAAAVPAGATAGLAGLAGRTLAKYGGQKAAQWAASKAGQAALSDMARGAIGSVPEALSEWGNTAQEANAMGMENPRLGTIGTFAGNMAVLPISNALEYSFLKGSLFRPSAKEGETWLQRLYKAPARAVPVVGLEGAQQSTEELLQTTVSDASLGIEVGNPLNPYSWTDRQRQAWEKGLAGSIGLGGGPGVYRATQVQEQQAELDNQKPVQGFDGKYWYENGYQPMSQLQEQALPFDKETPSFNEKDYEGLEGSIKAEGDSKKFNANDYAALKSIGFIDTLDNDAQQKAIYNAYANGTLSQEQAQQLLSKLNSEAAYALDKGLTQDQYLAEKNGFNAEQLGPSNIDTGKGSTKMPSAFMSKLFEQIMQEELAKQQAAERTRKGIAFAEAMRNTPTGKGVMPEIINPITGDAFSQPFRLGTITKATQNKALGATPSAYTSRKAMATGNAANQAINFPAQAGLNQSNMPIGSAQNLRQQVNAVNLALAANRGATDKTAFQQQVAQQPSDVNATADRLMAEQAQDEIAKRREAIARIFSNVTAQKWDATQQEYGNRRQQALQNIANLVNARAAGQWDSTERYQQSVAESRELQKNAQARAQQEAVNAHADRLMAEQNLVNAFDKIGTDEKSRQKSLQAIANIVNARAAGMWDTNEAENQAKAEARQAIANIVNARAAQQWDQAEKGKQNEKTEQKREAAKNTQGTKAEEKQNAQADKNVKQPKEEKPVEQKPVEQKPKEEIPKGENDNKINLPEGVTVEVSYNEEKNGVQLKFNKAPGNDVTSKLGQAGFKWSRKNQLWYSLRNNPKAMKIAKQFEGAKETPKQEETAAPKPSSDSIDLTTEQDKLDFKREEMTEAFGKLLGIDSVMSYDDAVKKFGEDRLNEGQVVLHIPNSKLYFIVEKYNEDDTVKHGMKYHVDAFDSKVNYDTNNVFDAKNEDVVAERVRNPKGENKPMQWQGHTPEDWMLKEEGRTITDWRGEKSTIDNISYSGGQWWATFDNGSTMSMESLEEYNRQLQNLTNNKEKALALQESTQKEAAWKDTTQSQPPKGQNYVNIAKYFEGWTKDWPRKERPMQIINRYIAAIEASDMAGLEALKAGNIKDFESNIRESQEQIRKLGGHYEYMYGLRHSNKTDTRHMDMVQGLLDEWVKSEEQLIQDGKSKKVDKKALDAYTGEKEQVTKSESDNPNKVEYYQEEKKKLEAAIEKDMRKYPNIDFDKKKTGSLYKGKTWREVFKDISHNRDVYINVDYYVTDTLLDEPKFKGYSLVGLDNKGNYRNAIPRGFNDFIKDNFLPIDSKDNLYYKGIVDINSISNEEGQATASTFKDNPESLINTNALNNMSLSQLNYINNMFNDGEDRNKAKKIIRNALLETKNNKELEAAARENSLKQFKIAYYDAVDDFLEDNQGKYPFFKKLIEKKRFAEDNMSDAAEEAYRLYRAGMENNNQDVVKSKVEKSTKEVTDNGNNEGRYSEVSGGQVSEGSSRSQEKRNLEQTGTGQLYVGEQQVQRPKTEHPEERPNTEGRNNDGGLPKNPRSGKGSTGTSERGNDVLTPAQKKDAKASEIPGHNYTITEKSLGEGGPKTKYENNIAAIKLLKKLEAENRLATPSEQKILAKYVGWGGLSSVFSVNASGNAIDPAWTKEAKEVKELLTTAEYRAARASTNTAFYTPVGVIKNIYKMLDRLGFKSGKILEPSMGTGNFFGVMPKDMREKSALNGVEIDPLTAKIAQQLYQRANIEQTGYEGTKYPDNFFDVVISNVPFGVSIYDPKYAKYNFKSHNYFFAKAMDQVRPGGLVCFVTSTDTMQGSQDSKRLRELLKGKADLIAAVRLPNTTFKSNAGTEVTSDIIILQKREPSAAPSKNTQAWLETVDSGVKNSWGQPLPINEYYANHPEMLIGELKAGGQWGSLILDGAGVDVEQAMQKLVSKLPKDIYKPRTSTRNTNSIESAKTFLAPSKSREGTLLVHTDGLVYQNNQGKMEALGETAQAKTKDYIQLRDTVKTLLQAQVDPQTTDEQLDKQRAKLNEVYDNFVKKHGYVNAPKNISSLSIDPDYGIIESIEDYQVDPLDKKKVTAKKRAVFTQRTVNPVIEVTKADNINDALSLSLSNTGNVDLAYISKLLGGQSESSIVEELGDRVYNNPVTEGYELAEEYLSGNVREKLEIAEMAAKANPAYKRNVEALKKVQPKDLQQEDVSIGLGTPWIPTSDIQQFAADLLNTRRDALNIRYVPQTGSWLVDWGWVDYNTKNGVENTQTWGTADKSFKELLSHALNQSTPTVKHKDDNGNYIVDSKATLAAQAKLKEIQVKFKDWIWQDKNRADRLLAYYNRNYNNWVLREYDGSALTFPGYSTAEPALKDHQKNAVWRIIQDGTALIAHCVGSGKTWTMQTAAMELKRLGLASKSMFVIPNHMLQQFENEFRRIYPNAKLLTLSNDTLPDVNVPGASKMKPLELKRRRALKNAKRQATLSKIATEDWDGIIISHNLFKRIPMSPTKYNEFYEAQLAELEQALIEAKQESKGKDPSVKELEKAKKSLETKLKRDIKEEEKDIVIPFEQLGIDQIFVDEADMFKNLYFPTKMTRIAGMSNTNSQRSMDMFMKTQYIQGTNNGRGVVFATGTPISNTMAEMFTMLRYLDMKGLKEKNLGFFDNWAATFATKETATELAPDGSGYRSVEKFTKFNNMPELIKMFRKVADVKKREDLDIKVPNLKNNKPTVIEVPMNSALKTYIDEEASRRANAIHNKQVDPTEDNMLKLTGDLRKASLDIRLVDPTVPAAVAGAKVQAVIDHTYAKYEETADKKGVQLIFCDLSTPKGASDKELINDKEETEEQEDNTNITVYEEIKKGLIKKGIPANQIAFIHDAKTKSAKEQLFERCRRGDIRVLIGSTEKMGAGTNIQNKLVALHHVDAPWRPRDIEQREGRILRQGNENEEVEIFNYVTKGSFDANMWEKIKNKAAMIGQAMSGDLTQRTLEDTDATVLSFAEIEALASGNPLMAERVIVNAKLNQYSALADNYKKDQAKNKRELATLPITLKVLEEKMQGAKEDIKKRIDIKGDNFSIQIGSTTYDSRAKAKEAIEKNVDNLSLPTIKLGGFDVKGRIYLKGEAFKDAYGNVHRAEMTTYRAEVIGKNVYPCEYTLGSMEYTVMNMPDKIYVSAKNAIESTQKRIKAIEAELNKPFKYQEEYEQLQKRSAEIEAELQKINDAPSEGDTQYSVTPTNDIQYSIAYHGTAHKFNEFDTNRIGSGIGRQIYGWGFYFAEDEAVAQTYRQNLSRSEEDGQTLEVEIPDDDVLLDYDLPFSEQPPKVQAALRKAAAGYGRSDMTVDGILDNFRSNIYIVRDLIENKMFKKSYRNVFLYDNFGSDVMELAEAYLNKENIDDIKDSIFENINEQMQYAVEQEMVDDDSAAAEKLSKQLTDEVVKTVKSLIDEESSGSGKIKFSDNMYGDQIYQIIARTVGSDKDASLLLNKYGIQGITYHGGQDGKCYVLFDPKSIKILRQYMLANNDIIPTRSRAEVEAEIRTAFPNGTIEYTNGVPAVTLPNGVKFQYSIRENIIVNAREQKRANAAHGTSGGRIQGFWQKFSGNGVQRLLAVAQNSERGTAFHEAMHAAIDLALTEKEANALRKYYQNKAKEQNRNVDEVIADAYRDWVLARQQKRGTAFGKLWQKIKDFCVRIRSLFDNGAKVQRIMQDVESGKVYERGANNSNIKKRVYFSKVEIQGQAGSGTTQRPNTRTMYVAALRWLRNELPSAKTVLDYGAGLGLGTEDMRANNPDMDIECYEPNPQRWRGTKPPTYTSNTQINRNYDLILNTNVLNVVEKPIRDLIVKDIASHLNMGGKALITTRSWNVIVKETKNYTLADEYHAVWVNGGKNGPIYQKGFDPKELKEYLEDILGKDFTVERTKPTFSNVSVVVTKVKSKTNTNNAQNVEASQEMPDSYKTLKGSPIKRSKYGVGKLIGGQIYLHKDYALDVIPKDVWEKALKVLANTNSDFEYNCVMYDAKTGNVRFDEAPDFDTAREPVVGNTLTVKPDGTTKAGYSKYIWHHKWIWVKNDYQGFDVNESKAWSQKWLGILTETADGNGIERWNAQLDRFGLEHDGENIQYSVAAPKSKIASAFTNTERKGTIQSVKDFFKEHWKSFYSDYVDKNDVLHAFDVLTNSGLTLYEQVQNLPSTTAGFLKSISEGTEKHIDAANKHLKNVKMKYRVTLAMALDTINKETMDKAHPDYLKQNGFDSWVNAFGAYLGAERLLEMNSIAKAQGEEYKLPKGLTEAELQQFVRNAPMQFKKAADIFYKVNDNMLSVMEDAGVFSHDLAQLLRTKYKKYCPLLRDFSDTAAADSFINGLTTGGRGIGNVSIPLKKISISGSERGVLNPLETVLKSYAVMLNRAERNKVGLMAVNSAKEAGMEDIIEEVPEIIGKNGEVVNAVADPKNCVFTVLVNGKKKAYKTTPELYGPIVGYNMPAAGLVFGVARTAAKMLRTGATMSPSFILRNVLRDTFFAGISSKNGFIPILDTLRGMNALWNDPAMRAEFEAAGVTEFNFYSSQEQRIKSIDAMAGEKPVGPLEMIKWAFRNLEAASDFMESATRMGEFMKARGKGLSIEEAARAAREVTLDFSRSGRVGEQINQVVPFFNACVQGGDKMRRLLREDFRGTATKLFKYIVLPSIFLWAMNYDEDWYKDLDPDIKNNYWCLGKNIRIPKPQEAGVLFGSGFEALLDQANGKDSEAMANWAKAFMSNMTPGIVPTLFLPLLEWQANYSYFKGRPLVSSKYQRLPDELQYNDYTSELSKSIGNNPLYKVSPMKVDNLVRGYTGTMGALLWSLPDYATDKAKNQPARNWYEYTPFRDFTVTDANMSRPLNDFYGMLDAANRQHSGYGVKGKPTQAVQAIRKTGMMISNIRKDIDKITKSKLTAERKRQLIDQRKAKMNQLARQANERYGKYFD